MYQPLPAAITTAMSPPTLCDFPDHRASSSPGQEDTVQGLGQYKQGQDVVWTCSPLSVSGRGAPYPRMVWVFQLLLPPAKMPELPATPGQRPGTPTLPIKLGVSLHPKKKLLALKEGRKPNSPSSGSGPDSSGPAGRNSPGWGVGWAQGAGDLLFPSSSHST